MQPMFIHFLPIFQQYFALSRRKPAILKNDLRECERQTASSPLPKERRRFPFPGNWQLTTVPMEASHAPTPGPLHITFAFHLCPFNFVQPMHQNASSCITGAKSSQLRPLRLNGVSDCPTMSQNSARSSFFLLPFPFYLGRNHPITAYFFTERTHFQQFLRHRPPGCKNAQNEPKFSATPCPSTTYAAPPRHFPFFPHLVAGSACHLVIPIPPR
jgi:hypothetical protein